MLDHKLLLGGKIEFVSPFFSEGMVNFIFRPFLEITGIFLFENVIIFVYSIIIKGIKLFSDSFVLLNCAVQS